MIRRINEDLNSLNIKYKDNNFIFIPSMLLLIIGFTVHNFFGFEAAIIVELPLITFVLIALLFHMYRSVEKDLEEERTHTQAIQSIYTFITPRYPLPSMSRWTAYPDLADTIVRECMINKPKLVVELGSGISTLITAYALEQHGENDAHIISLDHSQEYTQKTQDLLTVHELETKAQVLYSPLETTQVGNKTYSWYNIDRLTTKNAIDLLIVDGPPVKTNQLARYPALPLLFSQLSKECIIILDDAARPSEQQAVSQWLREFPGFKQEYISSKKGLSILRRTL
jgi:predicted O-methyltransferase YrrM